MNSITCTSNFSLKFQFCICTGGDLLYVKDILFGTTGHCHRDCPQFVYNGAETEQVCLCARSTHTQRDVQTSNALPLH
jgi:hypothetical protein